MQLSVGRLIDSMTTRPNLDVRTFKVVYADQSM